MAKYVVENTVPFSAELNHVLKSWYIKWLDIFVND